MGRLITDPIAICCSDLHLSHKAPVARSLEHDWYNCQAKQLRQLTDLQRKYNCPVICGGDIFNSWNAPSELVNFALANLPQMYAVPGNHDLPHHSYTDIRRTSFWTLVEAGKAVSLEPGKPVEVQGNNPIRLWGFPCGYGAEPLRKTHDLLLEIAVIHSYIWTQETCYPGAPSEYRLKAYRKSLAGYDVAVFGDNHQTILRQGIFTEGKPPVGTIINPGTFLRRKADEINHKPMVGILYSDGHVKPHYLDVSADKFLPVKEKAKLASAANFRGFIDSLASLGDAALDFSGEVKRVIQKENPPKEVEKIILRALEKGET